MGFKVLYDDEFAREINQGTLAPETFRYKILCEGDSWMDRSSLFQLSLPWALAPIFRGSKDGHALFINLARFGDTMRKIADCGDGLFDQWLKFMKFDAILFSAAGNDFIDAAVEPGSGNGILHGVHGAPPTLTADECYNTDMVADLVTKVIDPKFDEIYRRVRSAGINQDVPIFLNCYNMPIARPAPAFTGGHAWLSRAYEKNGIPEGLWTELTERIFIDVESTVTGWVTEDRVGLHVVPTTRVALVPAAPGSVGSSGDWLNEIHPNKSGWTKLAAAWQNELGALI
jgi:hypothetical protein